MSESKPTKKTHEKMDIFLQTIKDSVGTQLHGMNSTIAKMKEEDDDRYKLINQRIMNMEKIILDMDKICENSSDEPKGSHEDQNQGGGNNRIPQ